MKDKVIFCVALLTYIIFQTWWVYLLPGFLHWQGIVSCLSCAVMGWKLSAINPHT